MILEFVQPNITSDKIYKHVQTNIQCCCSPDTMGRKTILCMSSKLPLDGCMEQVNNNLKPYVPFLNSGLHADRLHAKKCIQPPGDPFMAQLSHPLADLGKNLYKHPSGSPLFMLNNVLTYH